MLNIIWTGFFLLAALSACYQVVWLQQPAVLDAIMTALFATAKTGYLFFG